VVTWFNQASYVYCSFVANDWPEDSANREIPRCFWLPCLFWRLDISRK